MLRISISTLNIGKENILLAYANDIVIIGKSIEALQEFVTELINVEKNTGLIVCTVQETNTT